MGAGIYICHTPADRDRAKELKEVFEGVGYLCWINTYLLPGEDRVVGTTRAILKHPIFLYIISSESLRSPDCLYELGIAQHLRHPVIPVIVRPVHEADIPSTLRKLAPVDYTRENLTFASVRLATAVAQFAQQYPTNQVQPEQVRQHMLEQAQQYAGPTEDASQMLPYAEVLYRKARECFRRDQLNAAISLVRDALEVDSHHPGALKLFHQIVQRQMKLEVQLASGRQQQGGLAVVSS